MVIDARDTYPGLFEGFIEKRDHIPPMVYGVWYGMTQAGVHARTGCGSH